VCHVSPAPCSEKYTYSACFHSSWILHWSFAPWAPDPRQHLQRFRIFPLLQLNCSLTYINVKNRRNFFFKFKNIKKNSSLILPKDLFDMLISILKFPAILHFLWKFSWFFIFLMVIIHSLKYLRSMTLGCRDIGIRQSEFVSKTPLWRLLIFSNTMVPRNCFPFCSEFLIFSFLLLFT